ncbi:dipicolinate synthase subunit A [Geomicrobium sp. JCM 19037]|uniref:dipicolinate synthase subunit DpsA n=1 Tax=unclassified Geomicrobium TaxID=2628951 RepID=UPI00045F183A|nr:dipicolinate synthase subunit DpsA [Geomicrobium sp. JCM 19037]GAK02006.1 dipicolinate synthase subunit A [Geomicrobium sp. JCM 19037]
MVEIAVLGGDLRTISLMNTLSSYASRMYTVGFNQKEVGVKACERTLENLPYERLNAIILPVQGVGTDGTVPTLHGDPLKLERSHIKRTGEQCLFITGVLTPFLKAHVPRKVISWMSREDVAIANSIPTAEGCLRLAIENTAHTIHGATVFVLGYGRCGKTIADLFSGSGANIIVYTNEDEEGARAKQRGFVWRSFLNITDDAYEADVCINTVPSRVLTPEVFQKMKSTCFVLDISSAPGAFDPDVAKAFPQTILNVPGIPGKVAPKSAGEILGKATIKIFEKEFGHET